jgi:glycerol-3-phosphate acyltransferase PlsY
MRVVGKPAGIFVLLVDAAKGFGAVCLGMSFVIFFTNLNTNPDIHKELFERITAIAGIGAVLGHNYTCWLKFKGGKGIATTAGVYLALAPTALGIAFVVFTLALLTTRYMSVASISGAIALPAAVWILQPHNYFLGIVTTALGALAIYRHKGNIQRLMAGTESRFGKKQEATK